MRASKKVKGAVLLAAGAALVLGAPTVHAESSADDNNGLLSGVNLLNDVQANVPITVAGVGAVLGSGEGDADVVSKNKSKSSSNGHNGGGGSSADDNSGLVSGVNAGNNAQVNAPVTVCGVGALIGSGEGDCEVKATNKQKGGGGSSADDNEGLVSGVNALNNAQLNVPVTVCGLAVLGDAECEAEVTAKNKSTGGGDHGDGDGDGGSSADGNEGLIAGLNLLNNVQANIPVTVCGLAVLGSAEAECEVEATNNSSTPGDDDDHDDGDDDDDDDKGSAVRGSTLPHTGAAGLALVPFGLALVAGGVALRRRVGSES